MAKYSYEPRGVCSARIDFEIENKKVYNVRFTRGCSGNTQGVARLVDGMEVAEVIKRLGGTDCNGRGTSCPDQFAKALELALKEEEK